MQWLHDTIEWMFLHWPPRKKHLILRGGYVERTYYADDKNSIHCLVKESDTPDRGTLVFFHGNGVSMYQVPLLLESISEKNQMNIISIEYRGYGKAEGKRTQRHILADIRHALFHLKLEYTWLKNRMIAVGQSLGTSVATQIVCSDDDFQKLLLINPFTSFTDMTLVVYHLVNRKIFGEVASAYISAFGAMISSYFTEGMWQTDAIASQWRKKTLILASLEDELIPYYQKQKLQEIFPDCILYEMEGGHNIFNITTELMERLINFCKL